jgi:hypothetical protein
MLRGALRLAERTIRAMAIRADYPKYQETLKILKRVRSETRAAIR